MLNIWPHPVYPNVIKISNILKSVTVWCVVFSISLIFYWRQLTGFIVTWATEGEFVYAEGCLIARCRRPLNGRLDARDEWKHVDAKLATITQPAAAVFSFSIRIALKSHQHPTNNTTNVHIYIRFHVVEEMKTWKALLPLSSAARARGCSMFTLVKFSVIMALDASVWSIWQLLSSCELIAFRAQQSLRPMDIHMWKSSVCFSDYCFINVTEAGRWHTGVCKRPHGTLSFYFTI